MVARELADLAGEQGGAVREEDLDLAQAPRVEEELARRGWVGRPEGLAPADVAIMDGRVAVLGPELPLLGAEEIDAGGLHVFPGGVDPHVHFNEPGRTDWEGIATGSEALAAGGFTAYADMPLNSDPVTTGAAAFDAKLAAASGASLVDFGPWG